MAMTNTNKQTKLAKENDKRKKQQQKQSIKMSINKTV